jgi:formylglycine-generating enzyme required for sulfatase activity
MAPEQVLGKDVTEQVDVYSFGILLYELLLGTKPIGGDTVERIFYAILNEPLNLEPLKQAAVPGKVIDLIARSTAKDPAARPQGFGPVCAELEQRLKETDPDAAPSPAPAPRKPVWLMAGIAVVAVALAAMLYLVLRPGLPKRIEDPNGAMVLVPGGAFLSGEKKQRIEVEPFYIDETEVTNAVYAKFAKEVGHSLPPGFDAGQPDLPVVRVSIMDAESFARWAGKRLPTPHEWEKAARGTEGRLFPWGDNHDPARANVADNGRNSEPRLMPARDFPNSASPYGALQMVGNAWEFVDELTSPGQRALEYFSKALDPPPDPGEPWYTIRGQSYDRPLDKGAVFDFTTVPARWRDNNIGFRCAKDVVR